MNNKTRTILAFVSGAAVAAIGLLVVNEFFPEQIRHGTWIIRALIMIFSGSYTAFDCSNSSKLRTQRTVSLMALGFTTGYSMGSFITVAVIGVIILGLDQIVIRLFRHANDTPANIGDGKSS